MPSLVWCLEPRPLAVRSSFRLRRTFRSTGFLRRPKGLLVFSEIHYPEGWQLTIDGEPAELLRVNYAFRAAVVPAGDHTVEMAFEAAFCGCGRTLASAGSGLLLLLIVGAFAAAFKGRGRVDPVS